MFTYAQIWWFLRGWSRFAQIRRIILRFNNYFFCLDELKLEFFWFLKFWNRKLRIEHQIEHNQNHNRYPGYVSVQFEWFVLEIIHTEMTTFNYRPTNFQKWFRVGWTLTWTIKTTDTETDSDMSKFFSVTREPGRRVDAPDAGWTPRTNRSSRTLFCYGQFLKWLMKYFQIVRNLKRSFIK